MSERERWIVYPLLFFALGASIRDKLLQRVEAKEIYCESLRIVDQQDPNKLLAELGFRRAISNDPTQLADRVGQLRLIDSDGREACEITYDMKIQRLFANRIMAVDPINGLPLVVVSTEPVAGMLTEGTDPAVSFRGVIYLNNRPLGTGIRLAPPVSQPQVPPPQDSTSESQVDPSAS